MLTNILKTLSKVVTKQEILPHSNCVLFNNNQIMAGNGVIFIGFPFDCDGRSFYTECLPLANFVKTFSDEPEIEFLDSSIKIKWSGGKAEFPVIEDGAVNDVYKNSYLVSYKPFPKDSWRVVKDTSVCGDKNVANLVLKNVCIRDGSVCCTDRKRMHINYLEDSVDEDILIPLEYVNIIMDLEPDKYAVTEDFTFFHVSKTGCMIAVRNISGKYPALDKVLPAGKSIDFDVSVKDMINSIKRSLTISDNVTLTGIAENQLVIGNKENDTFKETLSCDVEKDFSLTVNGNFVLDALKYADDDDAVSVSSFNDNMMLLIEYGDTVICIMCINV